MIERDYIMRMIQMLVQALADIIFLRRKREYPQALEKIRTTSKQLFGVEIDVLRHLSDTQIIDLLCIDPAIGKGRCYAAGMLLKEEAEISEEMNKTEGIAETYLKSLSLLAESGVRNKKSIDAGHDEAIDDLIRKFEGREIPIHILKKVFRYYEVSLRYAKAGTILLRVIDKEPGFLEEGIQFYARLRKKSDDELSKGGLSRAAIDEELNKIADKM